MVEDHGKTVDAGLPVASLAEALPHLRRPFTPQAIRWKVQRVIEPLRGGIIVPYIDARLVIERLNAVVAGGWQAAPPRAVEGQKHMLWCDLTVCGVTHSDVGEGQGLNEAMILKAAVSDSLKRAAVHFGVGVSVYALPEILLWKADNDKRFEVRKKSKGGETLALTEYGFAKLRESYEKWLTEKPHGYGSPLHHGDVEGQTIEDEPVDDFVPEPPLTPTDERTTDLIDKARGYYEREVDHVKLPAARFNAMLRGASHSHSELERFLAYLEGVGNVGS